MENSRSTDLRMRLKTRSRSLPGYEIDVSSTNEIHVLVNALSRGLATSWHHLPKASAIVEGFRSCRPNSERLYGDTVRSRLLLFVPSPGH